MVSWLRANGKILFRRAALLLAGAAAGFGLGLFFAVPAGPGCQESDLTPVPDTGFASPAPEAAPASSLPQEEPVPEKWVCLTFDDGPSKTTPAVLDALNTAGVKATFFVVATGYNEKYLPLIADAAAAGHQIALNFSSLMFVLPMSLAAAVTIRVGFRLGQGSTLDAQTAARTGLGVGVCMAVCTALFTVLLREQIALLYNDNPEVVTLASHLMLLAAIYQISDSIQVIGSGVLRGYKDTRSIFFITFIAYWVLGLPCGYILALTDLVVDRMGPAGFWMGFIIGLTSAAIMMMLRMRFLQRQPSTVILQRAAR